MRTKTLFVHAAVARNDVAHKLFDARHVFAYGADRGADARGFDHHRLDFAEFHSKPAQLDLPVGAAQEFDIALGIDAAQVSGAIHPRIRLVRRRKRVRHEALERLFGKAHVPARHAHAANRDLADFAPRDRPEFIVD